MSSTTTTRAERPSTSTTAQAHASQGATAQGSTFEAVRCPTCAGLGRSITLFKRDSYGNLYFIGGLIDNMRFDARLQALVVPCRVCHGGLQVPLTNESSM